jgi:hypothetical protein
MKFNLVRPCRDCPFRTDVKPYLSAARAREIVDSITLQQATFACHKTVDYSDPEDDEPRAPKAEEQHCAGATILLERLDRPNQMMRISERLGLYNRRKLDMDAPVYRTPTAFVRAQRRADR